MTRNLVFWENVSLRSAVLMVVMGEEFQVENLGLTLMPAVTIW